MTRTLAPFARVTLGEYPPFTWGDGLLKSVELSLAEGDSGNSCSFSIYDPGRKYTNLLLAYVEEIGGLEPLNVPDQGSKTSSTGPVSGSGTASGNLSANVRAALDLVAKVEVGSGGYNTQFGGGTFESFAQHPNQSDDLKPAGRYQFQYRTFKTIAEEEGLTDFTPESQDIAAVNRFKSRGAMEAIEAGDIEAAMNGTGGLTGLSYEWAALPISPGSGGRYGQAKISMPDAIAYFKERQAAYGANVQEQAAATESVQIALSPEKLERRAAALAGSQITIELGFDGEILAQHSFLHTGLDYSLYDHDILSFTGQSAAWALTQRIRTTAYTNVTFKQVADKICRAYGMVLDMPNDGPKYEYFPQRGVSDYQAILIEARRIGYRVTCTGRVLSIKPRGDVQAYVLERAVNISTFTLSHSAQGDSSGGARSSDPSNRTTTGQKKFKVDPDTGEQVQIKPENLVGAGASPETSTTGAAVEQPAPKTTGDTDTADSERKDNESRIKGITANWGDRTLPEMLLVTPDDAFRTVGMGDQVDRVWVCESIAHSLSEGGFQSSGVLYSPMANKYPTLQGSGLSLVNDGTAGSNPGGFIKPINAPAGSPFGPRGSGFHEGIDFPAPEGTPVWASADGVVTIPGFNAGGYGNWIIVTHGDGFTTRYGHLSEFKAADGQNVTQGSVIALSGNTGRSTGPHLHFEIINASGQPLNPTQFIKL